MKKFKGLNNFKGYFYGIATSVAFGLIPLFTLPLQANGMNPFFSTVFFVQRSLWH